MKTGYRYFNLNMSIQGPVASIHRRQMEFNFECVFRLNTTCVFYCFVPRILYNDFITTTSIRYFWHPCKLTTQKRPHSTLQRFCDVFSRDLQDQLIIWTKITIDILMSPEYNKNRKVINFLGRQVIGQLSKNNKLQFYYLLLGIRRNKHSQLRDSLGHFFYGKSKNVDEFPKV